MPDAQPDSANIEAGRILFARPFVFIKGCVRVSDLPPPDRIEVAFAGRSNVGKSSLINALTGRKNLARTSNTPGRTQELNIFEADLDKVIGATNTAIARRPAAFPDIILTSSETGAGIKDLRAQIAAFIDQ